MLGKFTTVHKSSDGGTTFGAYITDVIGDLSLPEITADTQEDTEYSDDTGDAFKTYDYGLLDGGTLSFAAKHLAGQTDIEAMETAQLNREKVHLQLRWAELNKSLTIVCLVVKVGKPNPIGEHVTRQLELKVSGKPVPGTIET